jgi:hypothetical protein
VFIGTIAFIILGFYRSLSFGIITSIAAIVGMLYLEERNSEFLILVRSKRILIEESK